MKNQKKLLFSLLFALSFPLCAQDSGTNGLEIGSQVDNTYSALVINGANSPRNEYGKRDIVFNFKNAGKSLIRSYRGGAWDTYMQFLTNNLDCATSTPEVRMHIGADGNIGIGTTSPLAKLDVAGKIRAENINLTGRIGRDLLYPFTYNNVEIDHFSLSWVNNPDLTEDDGYEMWASGFAGMKFFTNSLPRLVINGEGKVGIGTTNPQKELEVEGTVKSKHLLIGNGKLSTHLAYPFTYNNVPMDHFSLGWVNDPDVSEGDGYTLWMSSFGGMKFFTDSRPQLVISTLGNVGIGTETPEHKLDVNGVIRAKEIIVTPNVGADFVFDAGYQLKDLSEIKAFVEHNKHLPGIQPEREMLEEGVNMNEFQIQLLQKIEELTLYIIKQQEKIEAVENKLEKINK